MSDLRNSPLLDAQIRRLMIPAERVACVQFNNSLDHALLILIKSGYSAIPVLDEKSTTVQGTISKTLILDSILGLERIEVEQLRDKTVAEVMDEKVPRIKESSPFFKALELSINRPFLCVEGEDGNFLGILTRKAILALIYQHLRN
ncbi:CBS domain-containing protein [Alicyclobacillus tolerans]|uniref:cyclic-di-AMP-binding protein CbpB n=1 Tax=Alicyclobacillus tolerans TaxID=90970 RepID=UPI001F4746AE|nr:cyclic-di-AMP-binding protein CbpB [Alicyclobacillus tolerans]MCF8564335.1 CBS domain-containing protein [Alicyclobacillus tolerans]